MGLLQFARAKDDADFVWRIGAAQMVKAQQIEGWDLSPSSRAMVDWVFDNPMVASDVMVRYVSTNPTIASNVKTEMGGVDTTAVPDDDIQFVVGDKWDAVAAHMFKDAV